MTTVRKKETEETVGGGLYSLRRVAYHEAGHCVAALACMVDIDYVTIRPGKSDLGRVQLSPGWLAPGFLRRVQGPAMESKEWRRRYANMVARNLLAGRAAEELINGVPRFGALALEDEFLRRTPWKSDTHWLAWHSARAEETAAETCCGDDWGDRDQYEHDVIRVADDVVKAEAYVHAAYPRGNPALSLRRNYDTALRLLRTEWETLDLIAKALLKHKRLSGNDIEALVRSRKAA